MKIIKVDDYDELSLYAANLVARQINKKPNSIIVFPTGTTPKGMYSLLIKRYSDGLDNWSKIISFNLDEYVGLSRENALSYYSFLHTYLYDQVNINSKNIYMPNGEGDIEFNIKKYVNEFQSAGQADLVILGIGINGHIGFNEPGTSKSSTFRLIKLTKSTIEANAIHFDSKNDVPTNAISMGISDILSGKQIILLASGRKKAEAIKSMIKGPIHESCPASFLRNHKKVIVIIDNSAGVYV